MKYINQTKKMSCISADYIVPKNGDSVRVLGKMQVISDAVSNFDIVNKRTMDAAMSGSTLDTETSHRVYWEGPWGTSTTTAFLHSYTNYRHLIVPVNIQGTNPVTGADSIHMEGSISYEPWMYDATTAINGGMSQLDIIWDYDETPHSFVGYFRFQMVPEINPYNNSLSILDTYYIPSDGSDPITGIIRKLPACTASTGNVFSATGILSYYWYYE